MGEEWDKRANNNLINFITETNYILILDFV